MKKLFPVFCANKLLDNSNLDVLVDGALDGLLGDAGAMFAMG